MTQERVRLGLTALGAALGAYAIGIAIWVPDSLTLPAPVHVVIGWSFVGAGSLAWARRPENRTGLLMTLTGIVWFGRDFDWMGGALTTHMDGLATTLFVAMVAHQLVVFPHGRARSRVERALVASAYALASVGYLVANLSGVGNDVVDALAIVLALGVIAHLVGRWHAATAPGRRALAPIVWTGPAVIVVILATLASDTAGPPSAQLNDALHWAAVVYAAIPLALLVGLLRTRLHRAALGDLVVELSELPRPAQVRAALARALGDPSLEIAFWLPEQERYVDLDGRALDLPAGGEQAVSVLEHDGEKLAALLYDPSLLEDAAFVVAAGAAARLALENARLHADLRAQLAEVRASRARIVEAGDAERRRLERDLHDGAQQRLLGIRLALRLARGQVDDGGRAVDDLLVEAEEEVEGTLAELRALARGIHPAVLTEEGLAPALETLARRAPVPVILASMPGKKRLPAAVEAAAYFLASEALANVAKYAHATQVRIEIVRDSNALVIDISDDGIGGADAAGGSGLIGLHDRVEALNGSLRIESPPGRGTRLHAEIPCA
jgi:signal transduction histidine kinase